MLVDKLGSNTRSPCEVRLWPKRKFEVPSLFLKYRGALLRLDSGRMAGKKRVTTQKSSASSKKHKPSATKSSKSKHSAKPAPTPAAPANDDAVSAPRHTGSFPADMPSKASAKKDRKGKGPAFIPAVEGHDLSDMSSDDEEGAMDVDEDLEEMDQTDFLMTLDTKGMAT